MAQKITIIIFLLFISFSFAQKVSFGKLHYEAPYNTTVETVGELQKITFGNIKDNIIILNKIPNTHLLNLPNSQYKIIENQKETINKTNQFITKLIEVKNNIEMTAEILMQPKYINSGKINLFAFSLLNKLQNADEKIIEFYFIIPSENESYIIVSTSFKQDQEFAQKSQLLFDSMYLEN